MSKIFEIELERKTYFLKITKRKTSKRVNLKVNLRTKNPEISLPYYFKYQIGVNFFKNNIDWVKKQLPNSSQGLLTKDSLNIQGNTYAIKKIPAKKNIIYINEDNKELIIEYKDSMLDEKTLEKKLILFLKKIAIQTLNNLSILKAKSLGTSFNSIKVSDTISKWGSCSSSKNLQYNYRIIMAPDFVIDYITAHEIAHLIEFNHKENFWKLVNQLTEHKKEAIKWLKHNGSTLY